MTFLYLQFRRINVSLFKYIASVFGEAHILRYPAFKKDSTCYNCDVLERKEKKELVKAAEVHLVVAIRITTVTFAASIKLS